MKNRKWRVNMTMRSGKIYHPIIWHRSRWQAGCKALKRIEARGYDQTEVLFITITEIQ